MARKVVSQEEIKQMNELYCKLGTYSAVAREVGRSPGTVKKYIIDGYVPEDARNIIRFNEADMPTIINYEQLAEIEDMALLCILTEKELNDLKELQKNEVSI